MALLMILRRDGRVLLEERAQAFVDECLHDAGDVGIQLALGLAFELRLRQLHADHRDQAFADVVAGQIFFHVLEQAQLLAGIVDGAGERVRKPERCVPPSTVLMLLAKLKTVSE